MDRPAPGSCTVIVARRGAADSTADHALLRAVEAELGVGNGPLVRSAGMDRPEFRLIEGVDRPTADRLAGVAAALGYRPRVRDRTGIKWSNKPRRDGWGPVLLMLTTIGVGLAIASVGVGAPYASFLLLAGFLVSARLTLRWRMRQRFMPLVLDSKALITANPGPVEEASPVKLAAALARQALAALPTTGGPDLRSTQRELHSQLDQLEAQGELLHQATVSCLAALDGQLAWLAEHPEASQESMARVQAAIDAEDTAIQARDRRLHEIVSSIVDLERTAVAVVAELEAEPGSREPAAQLEARAAALRRGQLARNQR